MQETLVRKPSEAATNLSIQEVFHGHVSTAIALLKQVMHRRWPQAGHRCQRALLQRNFQWLGSARGHGQHCEQCQGGKDAMAKRHVCELYVHKSAACTQQSGKRCSCTQSDLDDAS